MKSIARHPSAQNIKVATDAVIFTVREGRLMVLLIQMKKHPYAGRWAVPGGLLGDQETSAGAARRVLLEQTGVRNAYLEQLRTFDGVGRDALGRVISVAYFALMPGGGTRLRTTEKYADVRWWRVDKIPELAYDHKLVVGAALSRLRAKLGYTNIAWSLLPREFPLRDLQSVYETILGERLDKRNFLKKLMALDLVEPTGKTDRGGAHRPAELYRFKKRSLEFADIL